MFPIATGTSDCVPQEWWRQTMKESHELEKAATKRTQHGKMKEQELFL